MVHPARDLSLEPVPDLSVILPAYNEGAHIRANLATICRTLQGLSYEVILVDDGSTDATFTEAQLAAGEGLPIRILQGGVNRGKGGALFLGFEYSRGRRVAFLDADLELGPENLLEMMRLMDGGSADVIIGAKGIGGSDFPLPRRLMSRFFRNLVRVLFDLHVSETQTGIKMFRREVLERCIPRMRVSRFAFDLELLVCASRFGFVLQEVPVSSGFTRQAVLGRFRISDLLRMFSDTLRIYYRASFWRWLSPGGMTKFWMATLAFGILLLGIGIGKLLTPLVVHPPLRQVLHIIFLQFLPLGLRDLLIAVAGIGIVAVALFRLNRILLEAFGRRDRGDIAGIFNVQRSPAKTQSERDNENSSPAP